MDFTKKTYLLDGGLASTLQMNGHDVDCNPLWSAKLLHTCPSAIKEVHKDFINSGANLIITSSYQASIEGYSEHLNLNYYDSIKLIQKSVELAKTAVLECSTIDRQIYIVGSIGPYGACKADGSEYTGDYIEKISKDDLMSWHETRIKALIDAGVDALAVETMPSHVEVEAILILLQQKYPNIKCWVSFSCKDELHTNYGEKITDAVIRCIKTNKRQLLAVGVNCTSPVHIEGLLSNMLQNSSIPPPSILPRIVYPNSGETWDSNKGWHGDGYEFKEFLPKVKNWMNLGARIVGGCCRIGPQHILQLNQLLQSL